MEIVEVVERPETSKAVQFNGIVEPELIEWCEGRATAYDGKWMLDIYDANHKRWVKVEPGFWIIKNPIGSFQVMSDEVYKKHFMGAPE